MTLTHTGKRIGRATACALALGFGSAASLAQSRLEQAPSTWQIPPSLTQPATAPRAPARIASSPPLPVPEAVIEKVMFDAGALFDFDTRELRAEGRATLDDFVGRLKGATLGTFRAVGHADRLGSDAYNQILSEDRAEALKAYLVGKGIESSRVHAEGRGATQPVTKHGECAGGKSAKLIACLQPDRRAGIEVAGTRPSSNSTAAPAAGRE